MTDSLRPSAMALGIAAFFTIIFSLAIEWPRWSTPPGAEYTNFLVYDAGTYWANAREIFDGGGWFFYANPYDLSPDPPRLYFTLFTIVQAHLWHWFGLGPAVQETLRRVVLGFAMFVMLDVLAGVFLNLPAGSRRRTIAHATLCAGGGAAALWSLSASVQAWISAPDLPGFVSVWLDQTRRLESTQVFGQWALAPARNLLFPNELYYHLLFFATIIALWTGRHTVACVLFAVTWLSHPFTAVELGTIAVGAMGVEWLLQKEMRRPIFITATVFVVIQLLGLAYYQVYLGRFETHREVVGNFQLPGSLKISSTGFLGIALACGMVLPMALAWMASARGREQLRTDPLARFAVVWASIVFVLVLHNKLPFVKTPTQPLHFGRSYLWVPLALLSLRLLLVLHERWIVGRPAATRAVLAAVFLFVISIDTTSFMLTQAKVGAARFRGRPWIDAPTQRLFAELNKLPPTIFMTIEQSATFGIGYDIPTWTAHRTMLAHGCNTPFLAERSELFHRFMAEPDAAVLKANNVGGVIGDKTVEGGLDFFAPVLGGYRKAWENERWVVFLGTPIS